LQWLITFDASKVTKMLFSLRLLCARAFALQAGQNRRLGKFAPLLRTRLPRASAKYPYALAATHGHQVLPALTRS